MTHRSPRKLGSFLSSDTLDGLGMPRDLRDLPQIVAAWSSTVDAPLAQHVTPARYHDGCLSLRADSPVWASKIRHQQADIVARLRNNPALRQLTLLKVQIEPLQISRPRAAPKPVVRYPSKGTVTLLEQVASDITDPGLRAALQRLARDARR
jgi:hypothetical protein